MPARHSDQTNVRTKLAALRVDRGIPQKTMARLLGMGLTAYQALERGDERNPRLGHLVNAAEVLGVKLGAVIEPQWLDWLTVADYPTPPERGAVWHTAPSSAVAQDASLRTPTSREALEEMARQARRRD
jgi:transcriptional regulator with XRE-family HTH domain